MEQEDTERTDDAYATVEHVDKIAVSKETVVDAIDYNGRNHPGLGEKAYFHIETPAEGIVKPDIGYFDADPNKREQTKDIRLRPVRFLDRGTTAVQRYPDRESVRDDLGADADEAQIDEEHDQRVATWRKEVRKSLNPQVEVTAGPVFDMIDVEYTD
jgi:hypothetical protein